MSEGYATRSERYTRLGERISDVLQERRKRRNRVILVVLILLALAAVGLGIYFFGLPGATANTAALVTGNIFPATGDAVEGHLPNMTDDEIKEQMQKEADATMFSFKINAQPVFADGGSEGTLRIENPNHNVYPFTVEIILDETGEKVYESGGVLPAHYIDRAKLNTVLEKGTYSATAYINAYDPDTNEYQGRSAVSLELVIQN